jgi:hypothetical protein
MVDCPGTWLVLGLFLVTIPVHFRGGGGRSPKSPHGDRYGVFLGKAVTKKPSRCLLWRFFGFSGHQEAFMVPVMAIFWV